MNKKINVLSVFDGISCGRVALDRAGFDVQNYYASEIDKHSITVSKSQWPEIVQIGDITKVKIADLPFIPDLIIGGSPCQGFSFSGKQLNFNDPRSALFFDFVRLVNEAREVNPNVKFLLENVKMQPQFLDVISAQMGVTPQFYNSSLVSAQSRPRYYWFNWQPGTIQDRGIMLKDILLPEVEEKYFISANHIKRLETSTDVPKRFSAIDPPKALCMTARQFANWKGTYINDGGRLRKLHPIECERAQTLPDNYTAAVSDSHRYKEIGNGWTVDIITEIFTWLIDQ